MAGWTCRWQALLLKSQPTALVPDGGFRLANGQGHNDGLCSTGSTLIVAMPRLRHGRLSHNTLHMLAQAADGVLKALGGRHTGTVLSGVVTFGRVRAPRAGGPALRRNPARDRPTQASTSALISRTEQHGCSGGGGGAHERCEQQAQVGSETVRCGHSQANVDQTCKQAHSAGSPVGTCSCAPLPAPASAPNEAVLGNSVVTAGGTSAAAQVPRMHLCRSSCRSETGTATLAPHDNHYGSVLLTTIEWVPGEAQPALAIRTPDVRAIGPATKLFAARAPSGPTREEEPSFACIIRHITDG